MTLNIFNTLTGSKEPFEPLTPKKVRMYVCGITSYDECHLGHARAAIVFDLIYRHLTHSGYDVTYVRNFTDVDDKIIKKANESGLSCEEIAEKYIASYSEAMKKLGVKTPNVEPRASQHINEMLDLIKRLEEKGFAYKAGRDVVYPVRKFSTYGKLSHKNIDDLESGARVEVDAEKKDPLDFVLWKGAKPGEPKWPSPWGEGRPGWHIECSAMSMKYLGPSLDIHGGGKDLVFPHHENEIAQSEAATEKPFVRYWLHNGFVNIDQEKMSKSLGNFRTIPDMLKRWPAEVIRFFLLTTHYRSPLNFTEKGLDEAEKVITRTYETLARLAALDEGGPPLPEDHLAKSFEKHLDDDFNSAGFIGDFFNEISQLNSWLDKNKKVADASRNKFFTELRKTSRVTGLFGKDPRVFIKEREKAHVTGKGLSNEEIETKIRERKEARTSKDWAEADNIRKELSRQGIELKDSPDGTTSWSVK